jgi:hypothetical protein
VLRILHKVIANCRIRHKIGLFEGRFTRLLSGLYILGWEFGDYIYSEGQSDSRPGGLWLAFFCAAAQQHRFLEEAKRGFASAHIRISRH